MKYPCMGICWKRVRDGEADTIFATDHPAEEGWMPVILGDSEFDPETHDVWVCPSCAALLKWYAERVGDKPESDS
jgi:hypothetical protein